MHERAIARSFGGIHLISRQVRRWAADGEIPGVTPDGALGQNNVHTPVETLDDDVDISSEREPAENAGVEAVAPLARPGAVTSEVGEVLPTGFAVLYETHKKSIFYLCLRMLGNPSAAEDAAHDVFVKAWRNMSGFRGDAEVRTWLYRIALNHCSNLRSSWHARNVHAQSDELVFEQASGVADSPFREVEMSELGQRIQSTLNALSEEYRTLLLLVADQELSYEQVAELTHQSADAVRGKLHRARKAFGAAFRKRA